MDMVKVISFPHGNRDSGRRRLRRCEIESEVVSGYLAPRVTKGKRGGRLQHKSPWGPLENQR